MERFNVLTRLQGRVALVTGSGQWIGEYTAIRLAEEGCDLIINDIVKSRADRVAEKIRAMGRRAISICADVTKYDEVKAMVAEAEKEFGRIDILVNNVGGGAPRDEYPTSTFNASERAWMYVWRANVMSAVLCSACVLPGMKERHWGRIVNLSSGSAIRGSVGDVEYSAAKSALDGFTRGMSQEVRDLGIRTNVVHVGCCGGAPDDDPKLSNFTGEAFSQEELIERDCIRANMPRQGTPDDMAALIAFLCSEEADYMNGQTIQTGGCIGSF